MKKKIGGFHHVDNYYLGIRRGSREEKSILDGFCNLLRGKSVEKKRAKCFRKSASFQAFFFVCLSITQTRNNI